MAVHRKSDRRRDGLYGAELRKRALPGGAIITSYGMLKLLPLWEPLRGDPRFEQIVASLEPKKR